MLYLSLNLIHSSPDQVAVGNIGATYHISFPVAARAPYGIKGSMLPVLLRAAFAMLWFGVQCEFDNSLSSPSAGQSFDRSSFSLAFPLVSDNSLSLSLSLAFVFSQPTMQGSVLHSYYDPGLLHTLPSTIVCLSRREFRLEIWSHSSSSVSFKHRSLWFLQRSWDTSSP